jgi:hypothetical protein
VTIVVGDHTITLKDVVAGSVPRHDTHGEGMLVAVELSGASREFR